MYLIDQDDKEVLEQAIAALSEKNTESAQKLKNLAERLTVDQKTALNAEWVQSTWNAAKADASEENRLEFVRYAVCRFGSFAGVHKAYTDMMLRHNPELAKHPMWPASTETP